MNYMVENENISATANNTDYNEREDIFVEAVSPAYPGTPLRVGNTGANVSVMQSYLNAIKQQLYPTINRLTVDGIYGQRTKTAVAQYQGLSNLHIDGVIGEDTWNSIVTDYSSLPVQPSDRYPGTVLRPGSTGVAVRNMQTRLNGISPVYSAINYQNVDGAYGNSMTNAVRRFQGQFGLTADGLIGPLTWNKIVSVYAGVMRNNNTSVNSAYPGYVLNSGSRGDSVRFIQSYLNTVNRYIGAGWPTLTVDGIYGNMTKQVVKNFQSKYNLKADGIVGRNTWSFIIRRFNNSL